MRIRTRKHEYAAFFVKPEDSEQFVIKPENVPKLGIEAGKPGRKRTSNESRTPPKQTIETITNAYQQPDSITGETIKGTEESTTPYRQQTGGKPDGHEVSYGLPETKTVVVTANPALITAWDRIAPFVNDPKGEVLEAMVKITSYIRGIEAFAAEYELLHTRNRRILGSSWHKASAADARMYMRDFLGRNVQLFPWEENRET